MKKLSVILVISMIFVTLSSCSARMSPKRPADTNLEFWITQDVSKVDFSGYHEIIGWYGARQYYGSGYQPIFSENGYETDPEHYVKYLITAWPDYADGGKYITLIEFTDPGITVYGLTVDSSYDEFERVFSEMGYKISRESKQTYECITAAKGRISFSLKSYDGKQEFIIDAKVTNRKGIVY